MGTAHQSSASRWAVPTLLLCFVTIGFSSTNIAHADTFTNNVAPILEKRCVSCHNDADPKGGLSLTSQQSAQKGGESGALFVAGDAASSLLIDYISGDDPEMPKNGEALSADDVTALTKWINHGAAWPKSHKLADKSLADTNWWSLQPLKSTSPKILDNVNLRSPIDGFIGEKLAANNMTFSAEADRRTLLRRSYYDLIGLPPNPTTVKNFVNDDRPDAYERVVDKLLASPRYGERWARHWLDVVHYGDTHGYDKDKLRPNAWPYRDYVIRSFNQDKPYTRFVREQLAGDALFPNTVDGIEATGFIAAGPWDFIGHAEVPETKIDGKVARHLDRDDMVRTTLETFCSTTVGCAQCHNHKFDPITMQDYYNLQSIFASIDRAEREYDRDPDIAARRRELHNRLKSTREKHLEIATAIRKTTGRELSALDDEIAKLTAAKKSNAKPRPEFGYHSRIESTAETTKWVQVDIGTTATIEQIVLVGCHDDFAGIGAGFGFPRRFRVEMSDDARFEKGVNVVADETTDDFPNPGVQPQSFPADGARGRYVRVTATKLSNRLPTDFNFALGELLAVASGGKNVAAGKAVTSKDSIEAPVRWRRSNLTDGYYYGIWNDVDLGRLAKLTRRRNAMFDKLVPTVVREELAKRTNDIATIESDIAALPPRSRAYVGLVHRGSGNFVGRAGKGPREIHVLHRGQVTSPGEPAVPAALPIIDGMHATFELPTDHRESDRRVALANWITLRNHPLTWRSIMNRLWQYHFSRALADSPNDLGRMGQRPSHPGLLDWLALRFRDEGQSMKQIHRLLVTSRTYRQRSDVNDSYVKIDGDNRLLWRMPRRRLEAEAIRDTTLLVADRLNLQMGGPAYRDFVLERPEHSPHYEYHKHNPLDAKTHRRSVYRFLVRSQPQPFMQTLDCADPSQMVDKRSETVTALQSLAMLNNTFMVAMSAQFAQRLTRDHHDLSTQIRAAFFLTLSREPTTQEQAALESYAKQFGLANTCRVVLNMNEFVFVD